MDAAAPAIFERRRRPRAIERDRELLRAACSFQRPFTIDAVVELAGTSLWYGAAQQLLRVLWLEGHLRRLTPLSGKGSKPVVYEWAED